VPTSENFLQILVREKRGGKPEDKFPNADAKVPVMVRLWKLRIRRAAASTKLLNEKLEKATIEARNAMAPQIR